MIKLPAIDVAATGSRITELREQAGMSVRDLQIIYGFTTPQAIYKWQNGISMPTIDNLIVLAFILRVKVDDIIVLEKR